MASWGEIYENPFTPISKQAAKVFGAWLRELVNERQPGIIEIAFERRAFVLEMDIRLGLVPPETRVEDPITPQLIAARAEHYRLRPSVDEVVFMQREHSRARFLLPEPDAIGRFAYGAEHVVDLPTCYLDASDMISAKKRQEYMGKASYPYTVDAQNYEAFLDPFMAAYTCSQCA